MSARPCGCDPEAFHTCMAHRAKNAEIIRLAIVEGFLERLRHNYGFLTLRDAIDEELAAMKQAATVDRF